MSACLFVYLLRSICLCVNLYLSAIMQGDISWKQCAKCVICVSSTDFFAPALPAQLFFSSQLCCLFAPVFLVHSLAVWVTLALQNMAPKARAPEARMVFGWDQVSGVEFCTCSGPSRCLPTVCIPSCCIFSPDQGRAAATISSRFGCMELSCHHQRTLSPMLQCCHFQHRGLGRYRAPAQLES